MKKLILFTFSLLLIGFVLAGVPINQDVQIQIEEDFNAPVDYEIQINASIYDAYTGGNLLYTQTENITPNEDGLTTLHLKNIDLPFRDQYYLGIKINTEAESRRINLTTNPYAFTSNYSFYSNYSDYSDYSDSSNYSSFSNYTSFSNYSNIANNTNYFDGYNRTTFRDWIESAFDSVYCLLTGCDMAGNINMNNNSIYNVYEINASIINTSGIIYGNGSQLNVNNSQYLRGLTPEEVVNTYQLWQESGNDIYYNSGYVGINTSSPQSALHLGGTGSFTDGIKFGDGDTGFYESSDDVIYGVFQGSSNFLIAKNIYRFLNGNAAGFSGATATATVPTLLPRAGNNGNTGIGSAAANQLSLIAGGSEIMRLSTSNVTINTNVGIGTSTPQNALDVSGGQVIGSSLAGVNTAPTDGLWVQGKTQFSGEVGIGTLDPYYWLDITGNGLKTPLFVRYAGTTEGLPSIPAYATSVFIRNVAAPYNNEVVYIGGSTGSTGMFFGDKNYYDMASIVLNNANDNFIFKNNRAEAMRFDSSNNLGLGTSTPQNTLNVIGDGNFTGSIYAEYFIGDGSQLTNLNLSSINLSNYYNQTEVENLISNGNVNSSNYWDNLNSTSDILGSQIQNDLFWINYTNLSQFTNDLDINLTNYYNTTQVESLITNGNVNSSDYWDNLNTPTDILGSWIQNDLNWVNYTNLSQFTNDLDINLTNYYNKTEINYEITNGNVNSSNYWDNLNSPADILGSQIQNNLAWINYTNLSQFTNDLGIGESYWNISGNYLYPSNLSKLVGIGTSIPAYELDINGDINVVNTSSYLYAGVQALKLSKGTDSVYTSILIGEGAGNDAIARLINIGYNAGYLNTGNYQLAIGYQAGRSNTGIYQNVIGYQAGYGNSGSRQTAIGYNAGYQNTADYQTAIGYYAGYQNIGSYGTTIGYQAGRSNTGNRQTAIGYQAGYQNSATYQTAFGYDAGYLNSGSYQTVIGYYAGYNNSGDALLALGYEAGKDNALDNQFIVKQNNINAIPLLQGDFANNYLGIGTATPQNALDVSGGEVIGSDYAGTNTAGDGNLLVKNKIGINLVNPQNTLSVNGDFNVTSNAYFTNSNIFLKEPTEESAFRINVSGTKEIHWRYENGTWVNKAEIGDSVSTDRLILTTPGSQQVLIQINESIYGTPYANMIEQSTYSQAIKMGNLLGDTYIDTLSDVYMQYKVTDIFGETQNISDDSLTGTEMIYNFTTPSEGQGFFFTGGTTKAQDYKIDTSSSIIAYTEIYDTTQSLNDPIWISASYYDFTQNIGNPLVLNETGIYRETFDFPVELLANRTYTVKTYFNDTITIYGTNATGTFIPYLRATGTVYQAEKMATYNFGFNNFFGYGNFTTSGNITLGSILTFGLGEFIDNLVDGWLRVNGNLNVTGNITGSRFHGEMHFNDDDGINITISGANVWTNVSIMEAGYLNGFTAINGTALFCQYPGWYSLEHHESFTDGVGAMYNVGISVNDEIINETKSYQRKLNALDEIHGSGDKTVYLNYGDIVALQALNQDTGADALFHQASLIVDWVGN